MDELNKRTSDSSEIGIARNDEPTRFLTEEEMAELEYIEQRKDSLPPARASKQIESVQPEPKQQADKTQPKRTSKIKIEEIKPNEAPRNHTLKFPRVSGADYTVPKKQNPKGRKKGKKTGKVKKFFKRMLLVIGFILAATAGFYLAFTWNMHNESSDNAQQHNMQQLEEREQKLKQQQADLEVQRSQLEQEKADLNAKHQELTQEKSFLTEIIDTVTGKDEEDKQKAAAVKEKIEEAQTVIDDVNNQLGELDKLKEQVGNLKSAAQEKINENKGVIDTIQYQIKLLLNNFL